MKKIMKKTTILIVGIVFLINTIFIRTYAKENERIVNFKRITIEDGLSQTTAQYIFQDSSGYMWIGTSDGLNRYDGYEFQIYRYKEGDKKSLSGNYISAINEDKNGDIWIGTSRGLNKMDKETKEIKSYFPGSDNCNLSDYNITEMLLDSSEKIYIATTDGLNLYDEESDNFIRLYGDNDSENKLTSQFIYAIAEDKDKNLWIGTKDGLNKVDRKTNKITNYYADGLTNSITENFIYSLYVDDSNNLWIGTYSGGLNKLNINTGEMEYYLHDSKDKNSIVSNSIRDILVDSHGITWIATSEGLSRLNNNEDKFINYKSKIYDLQSIVSNNILNLYEDNSGSIWIGTYDGISIANLENAFVNYKKDPFDNNSLSDNMLAGVYKDNDGLLWVGTVYNGLNVMDREKNIITKYKATDDDNSLSDDNIRAITGIDNEIWIATENGLTKYDKKEEKFTKYFRGNDNTLVCNDIRSLFIDSDGVLWIGTIDGVYTFDRKDKVKSYKELFKENGITETMFSEVIEDKDGIIWIGSSLDGGLIKLNKETNEIKVYRNDSNDPNSISFNIVSSLAVDDNNNIWVGTQYGLNKFNRENENFTRYTEENGLSNNFIYGILVSDNDLWISTNYGISKYDVEKNKFVNYDVTDGIQGNEFNGFSYYKAKDGELFFGGINGLTAFYPEELKEKNFLPNVVIGSIYINDTKILNFDDISVDYKNNNINLKFFLPDYGNMKKIQYQYKLVGLNDNWVFSDIRNYVNYTNLDAGKYTFMVRARNSTGEWSEVTSINFTIGKKPWKTPFAYMIYATIIFLIIYIIWNRVKILDSLVEQRTIELNKKLKENEDLYNKLIQNEKYKNNYFINLSHELRTPLNVIISVEQLISKLNKDNKRIATEKLEYYMDTLRRNSDRLLNLINNIIDTSKIESGSYKLNIKEHDIVFLVEEIALSMKEYIESNGLELIIDPEIEEKIIECDKVEIEKCVVNLIANAVKFTESGGKIEVSIKDYNKYIRISVKDTGIGIDKKFHESIFDRFGQAYNSISEENGGSGLGLTLTKQLVTLHKGRISVESEVNKGSKFIITLPVKQ